MSKPIRVQRSRAKGWKMPPNTVYVGRPTLWGNPFPVQKYGPEKAVQMYRDWLVGKLPKVYPFEREYITKNAHRMLRGVNLACFCRPGQPCHADVLLEMSNLS